MHDSTCTTPRSIVEPTLEAIDDLRKALDCVIQNEDERAAKAVLKAIIMVSRAVDEIDSGSANRWSGEQYDRGGLQEDVQLSCRTAKPSEIRMSGDEPPNRRESRRKSVRVASIITDGSNVSIPCVVLDRSAGGFRLHVHSQVEVPDRFQLHLTSDDQTFDCECVWRRDNEMGVSSDS